ncbi:MAG: DUF2892 domain-containing protein [Anaerolineae bacterium]|nr:DUF2892 domain-containing protein [Anaerolineae bacterium]
MDGLFQFLASRAGRITRIVIGAILVIIGLAIGFSTDSLVGWIVTVVGVFPIVAGTFDLCLFAPFFGKSYKGADLRIDTEPPAATQE